MTGLAILGLLCAVIGGLWLLVITFQTSIWWGLGSLLIPIVSLIFVITHWDETKKPFLIQLAGVALIIVAGAMAPGQPAMGP